MGRLETVLVSDTCVQNLNSWSNLFALGDLTTHCLRKRRPEQKTRDMGQTRILLFLFLVIGQEVHGFSFPNDWYKIRQMMEERRRKEQDQDGQLGLRGAFGGGMMGPVQFNDEYDDIDAYSCNHWSTMVNGPLPQHHLRPSLLPLYLRRPQQGCHIL